MTATRHLYFAYGSNMSAGQMAQRCASPVIIGRARLPGRRFFITAKGYANLADDPAGLIHGLLWSLTDEDLHRLDEYEGVREGSYERRLLAVEGAAGPVVAWIYLGTERRPGPPVAGYLEGIVAAARELDFPDDYRRALEAHLAR